MMRRRGRHFAGCLRCRDRITIRQADLGALEDPPGSFDLIGSEGAIYLLGFANGLRLWHPLLPERL
ncbi:hypothetical protein [Laspinema palackyanum]|uniref:hypothetical protein n=1 Tax=Laspinema palackyanum TaxID=3231601 RepID=UPI00345DA2D7|nr:hypothetical protein [Laspinema sp. D2c]